MDDLTVQDAILACTKEERSELTRKTYKYALGIFTAYLTEQYHIPPTDPVKSVGVEHFIEYSSWLLQQDKYSKPTLQLYATGAKVFMDWLVLKNVFDLSYNQGLRYKMGVERIRDIHEEKMERTPNPGDAESMLKAARLIEWDSPIRERNIALIEFLYSTGCRNDEAGKLQVRDVDLNDRTAIVKGKGKKERRVFLTETARDALDTYWTARKFREKSNPAFARHDRAVKGQKKRLSTEAVRAIVDQVSAMAGISKGAFTPHYFRHNFGIKTLRETGNLALVQDLMGHANPNSTRIYAKTNKEDLRKAHKRTFKE